MLIVVCGPTRPDTVHERPVRNAKRADSGNRSPPQTQKGPRPWPGPLQRICYVLRQSPSYFAACLRAERTAASMALLVTVAPATPSMSALWAASTCWA